MGTLCLRLPRAGLLSLLKFFPADEERIAQTALNAFDAQPARSKGGSKGGSVAQRSTRSAVKSKKRNEETDEDDMSIIDSAEMTSDGSSDEEVQKVGSNELHQRIKSLKEKRRSDQINTILYAAARGELPALQKGLKNDSVNLCDPLKRTPLHLAASEGQIEIVRFLVESGADVNALDKFKHTPLNDSVVHMHDDVSKYLFKKGAKMMFEQHEAGVLLCKAAFVNDTSLVRRLIENSVSPSAEDYNGRTALHLAASEGNLSVVEYLLDSKANVLHRDRFGSTALEDAVNHGHLQVQRLLRSRGGCLDLYSSAHKMCELAASGDLDAIKILVENGIDCSFQNDQLRTPSFEVNSVDKLGRTPLEEAMLSKNKTAIALLQEHGGIVASDPGITDLKKDQYERRQKINHMVRQNIVSSEVLNSVELKGCVSIEEVFLPNVKKVFEALKEKTLFMNSLLEQSIPILKTAVSSTQLANSVGRNNIKAVALRSQLLESQKLVETVITSIADFSMACSASLDALGHDSLISDFPRVGGLKIIAHEFYSQSSAVRRLLKVCLDISKRLKKSLQELLLLTRPRDSFYGSSIMSFSKKSARGASMTSKPRKLAQKQQQIGSVDKIRKISSLFEGEDTLDGPCIKDVVHPTCSSDVTSLVLDSVIERPEASGELLGDWIKSPKSPLANGWFETAESDPTAPFQVAEAVVMDVEDADLLQPLPWVQSVSMGWTGASGAVPSATAWRRLPGRVAPHGEAFPRAL